MKPGAPTERCSVVAPPEPEDAADSTQEGVQQIAAFAEVAPTLDALRSRFGASRVLVVFDLDNTLLTARADLGSDAWYTWQDTLLRTAAPGATPPCAATSKDSLLEAQGLLYALGRMRPTEDAAAASGGTVAFVSALQRAGHKVIVLTSRGPSFNDVTRRELRRNGMCFSRSAIGPVGGYAGEIAVVPTSVAETAALLPPSKLALAKKVTAAATLVRYEDGVFMTAGQHKGAMLQLLLARTASAQAFDAIVFIDDTQKHTERMRDAFDGSPVVVRAFHYVNPTVLAPAMLMNDPGRESEVDANWRHLVRALRDIYGYDPVDTRPDLCAPAAR